MKLKRILSLAVALAMVLSIVPAFSLTASAATVGDYLVVDNVFYNIIGDNLITDTSLDGFTNATGGKLNTWWETVAKSTIDSSATEGNYIHPKEIKGGNDPRTMRTFIPITGGKKYYVTNTVYDTVGNGNVGMAAIVATGSALYSTFANLEVYSHVENGGFNSWSNEGNIKYIGTKTGRVDKACTKGYNKFETIINAPADAKNIMISYGAWSNVGIYYGDFAVYEIEEATPVDITVNYVDADGTIAGTYTDQYYAGLQYTPTVSGEYYASETTGYLYTVGTPEAIEVAETGTVATIPVTKYRKLVSGNLIANGSFENTDNDEGWYTGSGKNLLDVPYSFALDESHATDGQYALYTKKGDNQWVDGAIGTDNSLVTKWDLAAGKSDYFFAVDAMQENKNSNKAYGFYATYAADGAEHRITSNVGNTDNVRYSTTAMTQYPIFFTSEDAKFGYNVGWIQDAFVYYDNFQLYAVEKIPATVTVNFLDENGAAVADPYTDKTVYVSDSYTYNTANVMVQTKDTQTYVLDMDNPSNKNTTIESLGETNVINLYYVADTPERVENLKIDTRVGVAPVLPATVDAIGTSGATITGLPVKWNEITVPTEVGPYDVTGTLTDFAGVTVTANITVKDKDDYIIAYSSFDGDAATKDIGTTATVGTVTYVDGVSGKAAVFDGNTANYLKLQSDAGNDDLLVGLDAFTVTMYANTTDGKWPFYATPLADGTNGDNYIAIFQSAGNKAGVERYIGNRGNNTSVATSQVETPNGEWMALTLVADGPTVKLYVNGVLATEATVKDLNSSPADLFSTSSSVKLGYANWNESYKGMLDEVKIYNVALEENEVQDLYNKMPGKVTVPVSFVDKDNQTKVLGTSTISGYPGNTVAIGAAATLTAEDGTVYTLDADQENYTITGEKDEKVVVTYTASETVTAITVPSENITVIYGNTPILPATVPATTNKGNAVTANVTWEGPTEYTVGEHTVTAKMTGKENITATAKVTVLPRTYEYEDLKPTNGRASTALGVDMTGKIVTEFDFKVTTSDFKGADICVAYSDGVTNYRGQAQFHGNEGYFITRTGTNNGDAKNYVPTFNYGTENLDSEGRLKLENGKTYRIREEIDTNGTSTNGVTDGTTYAGNYRIWVTTSDGYTYEITPETGLSFRQEKNGDYKINTLEGRNSGFEITNHKIYWKSAKEYTVNITGAGEGNNGTSTVIATSAAGVEVPYFKGYILKTRTVNGTTIDLEYVETPVTDGAYIIRNNITSTSNENGNPWLTELKYLGSHNSFTDKMTDKKDEALETYKGDSVASLATADNSKTQTMDVLDQLNAGVRYFDIRLSRQKDYTFWTRHGLLSEDFEGIAYTIAQWAQENHGEVILLDFQSLWDYHYKTPLTTDPKDGYNSEQAGDENAAAITALKELLDRTGITALGIGGGNGQGDAFDTKYNTATDNGTKTTIVIIGRSRMFNNYPNVFCNRNNVISSTYDENKVATDWTTIFKTGVKDQLDAKYSTIAAGAVFGVLHGYATPTSDLISKAKEINPNVYDNIDTWMNSKGDVILVNDVESAVASEKNIAEKVAKFNRDLFDGTYTNTVSGVTVEGPSANVPYSTKLNVTATDATGTATVDGKEYNLVKSYNISLTQFSNTSANVSGAVKLTIPGASTEKTNKNILLKKDGETYTKIAEADSGTDLTAEISGLGEYVAATEQIAAINVSVKYVDAADTSKVIMTVPAAAYLPGDTVNVPVGKFYAADDNGAYILQCESEFNQTVQADTTEVNVPVTVISKYAVTADGVMETKDGFSAIKTESTVCGSGTDYIGAATDEDGTVRGEKIVTNFGQSRYGVFVFDVPENVNGKTVLAKIPVINIWTNDGGNTGAHKMSLVAYADAWTGEGDAVSTKTVDAGTPIFTAEAAYEINNNDNRPVNDYVTFDVTELVKAAAIGGKVAINVRATGGGFNVAYSEGAVLGGAKPGFAAYLDVVDANTVTFTNVDKITKVTKNGSLVADKATVTAAPGASIKVYTNEVADGAIFTDESGEVAATVTGNVATITPATSMTLTGPREFGITLNKGAQVRIGQGVDTTTGKVSENAPDMQGSGLRFIATVNRTDSMAETADEFGIRIYPQGNEEAAVNVKATSFQDTDKTVFTAALTNLKPTNYNVVFVANPYVIVGGKTYVDKSQTTERSIYQVAAGLLVGNESADVTENGTELAQALGENGIKVLNAYLNQVGVRLSISDIANNGTVSIRDQESGKKGAYTGVAFFDFKEGTSTTGTNGEYTITLQAKGDNVTFSDFWNEYIRINNNNSKVVKGITVDNGKALDNTTCKAAISKDRKTLTFTFNYNTATATN